MPAYFGYIGVLINQELPRLTTGAAKHKNYYGDMKYISLTFKLVIY